MSALQLTESGTAANQQVAGNAVTRLRRTSSLVFIFPVLLNFWPVLLLLSQKALLPLGIVLAGTGSAAYRRDFLVAASMILAALTTFTLQTDNEYALSHLVGYALFIAAVPLINLAVRADAQKLIRLLALFSVGNALLAFLFYALNIDLSAFRGLNRIIGDDDLTHRVYFESTSLVAVFSLAAFKGWWRRLLATALVFAYAALLAKSVFVVFLYMLNYLLPLVLRGKTWQRIAALMLVAAVAAIGPLAVILLRPDVALSIGIKLMQFEAVSDYPVWIWSGEGWGFVIDEIVNSEEQPYQIEMQLPMLLNQIGILGVLAYAGGMAWMLQSGSQSVAVGWLRWVVYLAIGFNNPWLFVPSWYLTSVLLFLRMETSR